MIILILKLIGFMLFIAVCITVANMGSPKLDGDINDI